LQQRLTSGAYNEPLSAVVLRPPLRNLLGKLLRGAELASTVAIGAKKICVAEFTDCLRAICLTPAPEIASAEAAEDSGASGVHALALQRVENLFDRVCHD
jgi:hypothetical protein